MLKRALALLLCLLLLPVWTLADAAEGQRFRLTFEMDADAYPADVRDITPGIADLLRELTIDGTLLTDGSKFDLQAELLLGDQERTRTALRLFNNLNTWYLASPLLGDVVLSAYMPALLEFCLKGSTHLGVPFQRVAICLPRVHTDGVASLVSAASPVLFAREGSRSVRRSDVISLAHRLAELAETDRAFIYWTQGIAAETGYNWVIMDAVAQLPAWVESFVPGSGLTITVNGSLETWTAGSLTILRRETDLSGAQSLSVTLPPLPDGTTVTFDAAMQPDGGLIHGSFDLLVTDAAGDTVARLHADGSLPASLPVTRPFFLVWEAEGPAVGGDGVHLYFEGEGDGQTVTVRQLTPDRSAVMLTVTAALEPARGELSPLPESAVALFSVETSSLNALMQQIISPLVRGVLPLIAQVPASACQTLMNLLEDSGIFDLLTNGFDTEGSYDDY